MTSDFPPIIRKRLLHSGRLRWQLLLSGSRLNTGTHQSRFCHPSTLPAPTDANGRTLTPPAAKFPLAGEPLLDGSPPLPRLRLILLPRRSSLMASLLSGSSPTYLVDFAVSEPPWVGRVRGPLGRVARAARVGWPEKTASRSGCLGWSHKAVSPGQGG